MWPARRAVAAAFVLPAIAVPAGKFGVVPPPAVGFVAAVAVRIAPPAVAAAIVVAAILAAAIAVAAIAPSAIAIAIAVVLVAIAVAGIAPVIVAGADEEEAVPGIIAVDAVAAVLVAAA